MVQLGVQIQPTWTTPIPPAPPSCPRKKPGHRRELVRGKTGRVYGDLITLLDGDEGHPLATIRTCRRTRSRCFDAVDTVELCLPVGDPHAGHHDGPRANMRRAAAGGFINATDCADYLAKKGMPFRDAYKA